MLAEWKRLFGEKVAAGLDAMKDATERSQFITEERHSTIKEVVSSWADWGSEDKKKHTQGYAWIKKYAVFRAADSEVLVYQPEQSDKAEGAAEPAALPPALDQALVVSHQGRVFEDLHAVHLAGGHSKAKTFREAVKVKFGKSIPQWVQEAFVACCPTCTKRLPRKPSSAGHKPILTTGLGSRGQIDLIDFQSCPDGNFKFLLNYQDHGIKLYDNVALTSKRNSAIAFALLEIFTRIGPPLLLQADNGREFSGAAGKGVKITDEVSLLVRPSHPNPEHVLTAAVLFAGCPRDHR